MPYILRDNTQGFPVRRAVLPPRHRPEKASPARAIRSVFDALRFFCALGTSLLALTATVLTASAVASPSEKAQVTLQLGHNDRVAALAFTADGARLVSVGGSDDHTFKLWDIASGLLIKTHRSSHGSHAALSQDGRWVAQSATSKIELREVETGRLLHQFKIKPQHHGVWDFPNSIAFSMNGKRIAEGSSAGIVRLWNTESGRLLKTLKAHSSEVNSIAFAPDGTLFATASGDLFDASKEHTVKLWNGKTGKRIRTLSGFSAGVEALAISPDGKWLAAGSRDGSVKLWDLSNGRVSQSLKAHSTVYTVAFSPDSTRLATGSESGTVELWDVQSGTLDKTLRGHSQIVQSLAFSPDGARLASGSWDHTTALWDTETGARVKTFGKVSAAVNSIALSSDGAFVAAGGQDRKIRQWDLGSGRLMATLEGHSNAINSVAASPDGTLLASGSWDGTIKLWELPSGKQVQTWNLQPKNPQSVAFSPDGKSLASSSADFDSSAIRLWDVQSGRVLRTVASDSNDSRVQAVTFSPDGRQLAAGVECHAKLWQLPSGRLLQSFMAFSNMGCATTSVVFSQDGERLAAAHNNEAVGIWDLRRNRLLRTFESGSVGIHAIALSPDGRYLASGTNTLKIWDANSGRLLRTLPGHSGEINAVAVTPDGQRLLSGSADETIRVWRMDNGEPVATMAADALGNWVTITPEGFFDASEHGASMLAVAQGLKVFTIDQAYQSLYRPDLVQEKLAGDPNGLVREAAAKLDLDKIVASGPAPKVAIVSPEHKEAAQGDEITVEASIADQGGGVGKVEWRINGTTLGIDERGLTRVEEPAGAAATKVKRTLSLEPGDNRIEVVAYNEKNLIASVPAQVTVTWDGDTGATPPKLYVLTVGVNDYWDGRLKLTYAVPDAEALAKAFRQAGGDLYGSIEARTVKDAEVTAGNLDQVFAELAKKVHARDAFVFFLAGHGKTVDGRYYYIPQDFRYEGEDSIAKKGIDQDRLQAWFAEIPARRSVLLFDTCESGSLTGERVAQRGLERVAALERMTRAMGRTVLSAATEDAPALEGYRGHGVFTYALLEALGGADANANGKIEVTELASFIDQKVPEISYEAFKQRQVPQMKIVGSNFAVSDKLAVLPMAGEAGAEPPPSKPTHVVLAPTDVFAEANAAGAATSELVPGTAVALVRSEQGWVLIAKDGKPLGYVPEASLAPIQ